MFAFTVWLSLSTANLPCSPDASLERAAEQLSRQSAAPTASDLESAVRAAGSDLPATKALRFPNGDQPTLQQWIAGRARDADAPLVCGLAAGATHSVAVVAARGGSLSYQTQPRSLIKARLAPRFERPRLVLRLANGKLQSLALEGPLWTEGLLLDTLSSPVMRAQLMAAGPRGVRPVAEIDLSTPEARRAVVFRRHPAVAAPAPVVDTTPKFASTSIAPVAPPPATPPASSLAPTSKPLPPKLPVVAAPTAADVGPKLRPPPAPKVAAITPPKSVDASGAVPLPRSPKAPTVAGLRATTPQANATDISLPASIGDRHRVGALMTRLRREHNVAALRLHRLITDAAAKHAAAVCSSGVVAHSIGDALGPQERLKNEGIEARTVGEAIAAAQSLHRAMDRLKESPSHLITLVDSRFTDVGFGVARTTKGRTCVVVMLAAWPRYAGR